MAFLIQVNEGVKSVVLPLCKAVILIGRDADSNLYLDDSGISKNHASIVFSNNSYTLRDNGSSSGSIVNGVRVREQNLAHDDIIQFGPYLFKVDLINPIPVTTTVDESDVTLERAGHSYTRRVQLPEIAGLENNGSLQVVMSDPPRTLPPPLPAAGFLENLSIQERQNLSLRGTYRYAQAGEILIQEGLNPGRLFLLISGKWEARREEMKTFLGMIRPGEWVGEVNLFDPAGAVCSVVAVESSQYWEISRDAFEKFINDSRSTGSAILIALAATLGQRIRQSNVTLQQAISSNSEVPSAPRSKFPAVFAAMAALAIIAAVVLFLRGNIERQRFQAEKQQLEQARRDSEQKAARQVESLEASIQKARAELKHAVSEKEDLAQKLEAARNPPKAAPQVKTPAEPDQASRQDATAGAPNEHPQTPPAPQSVSPPDATLPDYPSKVVLTRKTSADLTVDGKVSGKAVLPEGLELPVVGAEQSNLIVEFGDSYQEIPKNNTNFTEALLAEAEAKKKMQDSQKPAANPESKPTPAPVKSAKTSKNRKDAQRQPAELNLKELTSILQDVRLLETLDEMRDLKNASHAEVNRFMRLQEYKWKRASAESARLLSSSEGREEFKDLLKQVIEASEMLDPGRLEMFQSKLQEIDGLWLSLKTEEKIKELAKPHRDSTSNH